MTYEWIKVLHVTAVITWMGVMILTPAMVAVAHGLQGDARPGAYGGIRLWYLRIGSVAMLATWGFGILLVSQGGWLQSGWMASKLGLVLALSAFHGVQSGRLRRLADDRLAAPRHAPVWPIAGQIAAIAAIVALVVLKPF